MGYRRTSLITAGCLAVLAGLGVSRITGIAIFGFLPLALVAFGFRKLRWLALAIFIGLSLGLYRGHLYTAKLYEIQRLNNQKLSLVVKATTDAIYGYGQQLDFTGISARIAGNIKVSGFGLPMVYRGETVKVSGKLRASSGSYQSRISYAQLEKISDDTNPVNKLTRRFSAGMQTALPEPNSSFGLGLLIGQRNNLPNELYQQLIMVGLVHIVAVSGYNLTILIRAASRLKLFSKYQQLVLSLALIGIFLLMTGFAASIVRAALVSTLSLWASFYGHRIRPVLILSFAAALTGLANPFYVWGDLGWYLSFLAFAGILLISPILSERLFRRPPKLLAAAALETFCAELMALPFIMLMFGQLSLIGLIANVLIVPLVPLAMLLSTIAGLAGLLIPAIAGWLAWPANIVLTYMLDLVRWFVSLPGIFQKRSISLTTTLIFYSFVGLTILIFKNRRQVKTVKIKEL